MLIEFRSKINKILWDPNQSLTLLELRKLLPDCFSKCLRKMNTNIDWVAEIFQTEKRQTKICQFSWLFKKIFSFLPVLPVTGHLLRAFQVFECFSAIYHCLKIILFKSYKKALLICDLSTIYPESKWRLAGDWCYAK